MSDLNQLIARNYDFSQFLKVVQITKTEDNLLMDILRLNPKLQGLFFSPVQVLEKVKAQADETIKLRCDFFIGDLSNSIPSGYQLYILKNVFNQLDNNQVSELLNRFYLNTELYSRLLIIEKVISEEPSPIEGAFPRVESQYRDLFKNSKFILTNSIDLDGKINILEVLRM